MSDCESIQLCGDDELEVIEIAGNDEPDVIEIGEPGPPGVGGGTGEKTVHMVGTVVPLAFSLIASALSARTITVVKGLRTASGSCTVTIAINGLPVTGLSGLAASSTPGDHTATAANDVAEGDEVTVTIADVSGATDLKFTIGME